MSSRIMIDAGGPGDRPPPVEEPQRAPQEVPEHREPEPAPSTPPVETPPPEPSGEPDEAAAKQEAPDAIQKRIDRLNFERHEAIRQRDEAITQHRQFVEQMQQRAPENVDYQRGRMEAEQARVAETFNQACNTLFNRGVEEYGQEMGEARDRLNAVGWGNRPDALAAVTQLPDGHRVYRELSRDLDLAARILNLPPIAMAMELTRMSVGGAPRDNGSAVPVSRAPEPVSRIGGHSRPAERPLDHPQTTMAEFIRRRDASERRSRIQR